MHQSETPEFLEKNILPKDGIVYCIENFISLGKSISYFLVLQKSIEWEHDEVFIFGKKILTKRKVAWYGDKPFGYTYSKRTKLALPWTKELLELKQLVEQKTNETFNSCLLNRYDTGTVGMGWHSDNEKELKENGAIASLSFGAERKFAFKHKRTKEMVSLVLENGSLLVMKEKTQTYWLHSLPPTKKVFEPRINLTFRTIIE